MDFYILLTDRNRYNMAIILVDYFNKYLFLILYYKNSPRSPTAHVHVATGGNIIRNQFLIMAKCRGNGREPSQRVQRAGVAVLWC